MIRGLCSCVLKYGQCVMCRPAHGCRATFGNHPQSAPHILLRETHFASSFSRMHRWLSLLCISAGLVLSYMSLASCRFVDIDYDNDEEDAVYSPDGNVYSEAGLFQYYNETAGSCLPYHQTSLDFQSIENGARTSGLLAPVMATFAFLLILCLGERSYSSCVGNLTSFALFLAVLFQGLTFLMFKSTFWYVFLFCRVLMFSEHPFAHFLLSLPSFVSMRAAAEIWFENSSLGNHAHQEKGPNTPFRLWCYILLGPFCLRGRESQTSNHQYHPKKKRPN